MRCNTWMEMGEPCQPKYYLLMVVSRCWGGAWLVAVAVSRLASVLASLLLTRCSGALPIMHHAEQGPGSRSFLTPVTVTDLVQRSAAAGARRGNVEPAARLARAWPAPGLGWWLIFSGFGRPPRGMRSWWPDPWACSWQHAKLT